jgi:hypothetical protein
MGSNSWPARTPCYNASTLCERSRAPMADMRDRMLLYLIASLLLVMSVVAL